MTAATGTTMTASLADLLADSKNTVFFGGAGVSTESGIPDFRSETGLYAAKEQYGYPPEVLLSIQMLEHDPALFFKYYTENLIDLTAKPNPAHLALAELEKQGKMAAVITQNIDGLHKMAGSQNVIELHGSNWRPYCVGLDCDERYTLDYLLDKSHWVDGVPTCEKCGSMVRPDVVLYGEMLDDDAMYSAAKAISEADLLIVAGTSLAVYPAAGLVSNFSGRNLVLINKTPTALDNHADLVIREPVGEVFAQALGSVES